MTTTHKHPTLWAHDFDNSARHCFRSTLTGTYQEQAYPHGDCPNWRDHQKSTGRTEWLRFIHAFGDQITVPNPFTDTKAARIFFETDGHPTSDGRVTYSETYLRIPEENSIEPVFRVFISNDDADRWARIECYEADLFEACKMALAAVSQGYVDEIEAAMVPS